MLVEPIVPQKKKKIRKKKNTQKTPKQTQPTNQNQQQHERKPKHNPVNQQQQNLERLSNAFHKKSTHFLLLSTQSDGKVEMGRVMKNFSASQ